MERLWAEAKAAERQARHEVELAVGVRAPVEHLGLLVEPVEALPVGRIENDLEGRPPLTDAPLDALEQRLHPLPGHGRDERRPLLRRDAGDAGIEPVAILCG